MTITDWAGWTALVVGGTGFIGSRLLAGLRRTGAVLHAVSRSHAPGEEGGVHWWQCDFRDPAAVERVVQDVRPDTIFQLTTAGQGGREIELVMPVLQDDLVATVNLLLAARRAGVKRVVMTGSLEEPRPSDAPPVPSSPYAAAKWAACGYGRMFAALYDLPVVILRPFMTYGPGQRAHKLIPYATLSLLRGESPKLSSGNRPVDWIYIDDVVDGFMRAARAPDVAGQTIDLGSGQLVPIRQVIERLSTIVGGPAVPQFGSIGDRPMEQVRCADTAPAAALLGWRPATPLDEGLRQTVAWFRTAAG